MKLPWPSRCPPLSLDMKVGVNAALTKQTQLTSTKRKEKGSAPTRSEPVQAIANKIEWIGCDSLFEDHLDDTIILECRARSGMMALDVLEARLALADNGAVCLGRARTGFLVC